MDSQQIPSQTIRIRTGTTKTDLKNRLTDKGHNSIAMPSVKRPLPTGAKPLQARMKASSSKATLPAIPPKTSGGHIRPLQGTGSEDIRFGDRPFGASASQKVLGPARRGLSQNQSEQSLLKSTKMMTSTQDPFGPRASSKLMHKMDSPLKGPITEAKLYALESIEASHFVPMRDTQKMSNIATPQYTDCNMAPYSRPQTQHFGYRLGSHHAKDPSGRTPKASEEVISITGLKSMTQLGPAAMPRPKTSQQEILQKRAKSNKQLKRMIIGGKTEMEEKRREVALRLKEQDMLYNQSTQDQERATSAAIQPGQEHQDQEFLKQRLLMTKMRGKLDTNPFGMHTMTNFRQDPLQQSVVQEVEEENYETKDQSQINGSKSLDPLATLDKSKSTAVQKKQVAGTQQKFNDLDKLITLLQSQPDDDGFYIYLGPQKNGSKDPYDLEPLIKEEEKKEKNPEKFFTLSKKGITTYMNDEPVEYITLTDWLIERNFYQRISNLGFFKQFNKWKILRMWRRNILQKKREEVKQNLQEKLFMLDDVFGKILRETRANCKLMERSLRLVSLPTQGHEACTLQQFADMQDEQRENVEKQIRKTSDTNRKEFKDGIEKVLAELRHKINEEDKQEESQKKEYTKAGGDGAQATKEKHTTSSDPVFEQLGFKHNLKYGPRSKLRRACSRFLRFAYLLDFVALDALRNIFIESVYETLGRLDQLSRMDVNYDLVSSSSQVGGASKSLISAKYAPFFSIAAKFLGNERPKIPDEHLIHERIPKFETAFGHTSAKSSFDPTVHLELKEPDDENADEETPDPTQIDLEAEEAALMVERVRVRDIHVVWLDVEPSRKRFTILLRECFERGLESLKNYERWSRHEELKVYVNVLESWDDKVCEDEWESPDAGNKLDCEEWLKDHPAREQADTRVTACVNIAFDKVETFFSKLQPYLHAVWENQQLGRLKTDDEMMHDTPPESPFQFLQDPNLNGATTIFPLMIERFKTQKSDFEDYIHDNRDLGMLKVDFREVKKEMIPSPQRCLQELKKKIPSMVKARLQRHRDWIEDQVKRLTKRVESVDDFVAQVNAIEDISEFIQSVKDDIAEQESIQSIFVTADQEIKDGVPMSSGQEKQKKQAAEDLAKKQQELERILTEAKEQSDNSKEERIKQVKEDTPVIKKWCVEFAKKINDDKYQHIENKSPELIQELEDLEKECAQLVHRKQKQLEYQRTLEMPQDQLEEIEVAKLATNARVNLWRALVEWERMTGEWEATIFDEINAKDITKQAEYYHKVCIRCEKELPQESTAVQRLKNMVFQFKEAMPIVTAFKNENLQVRHWNDIKEILNLPAEDELHKKQFTLGHLVLMGVAEHQDDLQKISTTATQQADIEDQLQDIEKRLEDVEFNTKLQEEHSPNAGMLLLGDNTLLQEFLDETLNQTVNILGNRFISHHSKRANKLSEKLNLIAETYDLWREAQRGWLYLDNIFASSEIRTECPIPNKIFASQTKNLEKSLKRAKSKAQVSFVCSLKAIGADGTLKDLFDKMLKEQDEIQKALDDLLLRKRGKFPRFYFVSDEELLKILANSKNLPEIEKNLNKCFDNVCKYTHKDSSIEALHSNEGEELRIKPVKAGAKNEGPEVWLEYVRARMCTRVWDCIKEAGADFRKDGAEAVTRKDWVMKKHLGQAICCFSQVLFTEDCEYYILDMPSNPFALQDLSETLFGTLKDYTGLIRGKLTDIQRKILVALITTEVHGRDIVDELALTKVENLNEFEWQKQLRYYIIKDESGADKDIQVRQVVSNIDYGYEYMGATSRLVITPLTDRCWITITGAMAIHLGAAPAGPAGTGKTESTKDLAKALGVYCVVFNCSDQIDFKMMERLFSGVAQTGAWTCLDEFNRIEVEVLSVIAQQLLDIKEAKSAGKDTFAFGGVDDMPLKRQCGIFITMNPGYAGRAELPDNLKVLFRPVSMMIPSYRLIAEIMLFAEGFNDAPKLSVKMVQLYKLASEQLSQQKHYDFGMRAVKSVLVMAGSLNRANPGAQEDVVLIKAMRNSNVPKFLADDLPLFEALIRDLFPRIEIPVDATGELQEEIVEQIKLEHMVENEPFILKVIQLFDTFNVRFGVMLVGPTGGGKTKCFKILAATLTALGLREQDKPKHLRDNRYRKTTCKVLNPKSISMGELYGEIDQVSKDWTDGLASSIIRQFVQAEKRDEFSWTVFDGPVDALWIENMNTVLDDNMTLCLANGERIKLNDSLRMLFEVQDLEVASPATVSRCGMVYMTPSDLGWRPYAQRWVDVYIRKRELPRQQKLYLNTDHGSDVDEPLLTEMAIEILMQQFEFCEAAMAKIKDGHWTEPLPTCPVQLVASLCNFLEYFIKHRNSIGCFTWEEKFGDSQDSKEAKEAKDQWVKKLRASFGFSFFWSFGASFNVEFQRQVDTMCRDFFGFLKVDSSGYVLDYYFDEKEVKFKPWELKVKDFKFDTQAPFFSLLVPTVDTTRFSAVLDMLVTVKKHIFFTGSTGVGKSVLIQKYLQQNQDRQELSVINISFSAQTTSKMTQETIESKLVSKAGKEKIGPKGKTTAVIFVDDINMPLVEEYGAQPPIELLRQLVDLGGLYNRQPHFWKDIDRFILLTAAAPPTGGRYPLTPRIMRHFQIFNLPDPDEDAMRKIFEGIMDGFLIQTPGFIDKVKKLGKVAVAATIDMYSQIKDNPGLKPIPTKFHYTFNLRDVAKVFQGILMVQPLSVQSGDLFAKLWLHECQRVFFDRLVSVQDREIFQELALDFLGSKFSTKFEEKDVFGQNSIIFSKILKLDSDQQLYEQIADKDKLLKQLNEKLEDYNMFGGGNRMDLVFFEDAVFHLCRILRILTQPRGNAMLIGVSGCGKQSLTRLSSQMLEYDFQMVTITKSYKAKEFKEDMRVKMKGSVFREDDEGVAIKGKPTTFLMTDTQITQETFLEDLNNVLNTGEITNLYKKEDKDQMKDWLTPEMEKRNIPTTPEETYAEYISQVRDNFHIILCMSPVGDTLRIRCRMFPSLVNCCTLDWYDNWPEEALLSVSSKLLMETEQVEERYKEPLAELFASVHKDIEHQCEKFYAELRRKVYITPKSYLDGINLYLSTLTAKRDALGQNIGRLAKGILMLKTTKAQIAGLQVKLKEMEPQIIEAQEKGRKQQVEVEASTRIAEEKEAFLAKEKYTVEQEAIVVNKIKDQAAAKLDEAQPIVKRAETAVAALEKKDVDQIRGFAKPSETIQKVVECVMVYLGKRDTSWKSCQTVMQQDFQKSLRDYPKDKVGEEMRKKVKPYLGDKTLTLEKVQASAAAAAGIFNWCHAINDYSLALEKIRPLQKKVAEAEAKAKETQAIVDEKEAEYSKLMAQLEGLKKDAAETAAKLRELEEQQTRCNTQLSNAAKLLSLLGGEGERWEVGIKELEKEREQLVGDIFIAAAQISYVGPFTGSYRDQIEKIWQQRCTDREIPFTPGADLIKTVGDPVEIQSWGVAGLPSDEVSTKNGILATRTSRWPLLIDPQTQGNSWIKKLNQDNPHFQSVKLSGAGKVTQKMERALEDGSTVLIEDCPETIDPGLDPILTKATYSTGADKLVWIKFNERAIIYNEDFNLFLTTKMANPHFLPETCIKLTIINFTVTFEGLEQQLLVEVVNNERPEVEEKRVQLVLSIANGKRELNDLQKKILKNLSDSDASTILDNTTLIQTLEVSAESSFLITKQLVEAEEVEVQINETRNKYITVSTRGSILYFVIVDLAGIDPMYENSLKYVKDLFIMAMQNAKDSEEEQVRIQNLIDNITIVLYNNICRGLFESHKLLFSLLICTSIMRNSKQITEDCWKFFLRGAGLFDKSEMPEYTTDLEDFMNTAAWDLAYCLESSGKPQFEQLTQKIKKNKSAIQEFSQDDSNSSYLSDMPLDFDSFDNFSKLLIIKLFKPQKLLYAAQEFVKEEMGAFYAEAPVARMDALFADSSKTTPIIFILSQGADPTDQLIQFAQQQDFQERFILTSLGQGQEVEAERMIKIGKQQGMWVLLQNCHLFKTWMGKLAELCEQFDDEADKIHSDFRLILTSMPVAYFPTSVLQNGLKMTTEPPKGLKANLARTYNTLIDDNTYQALRRKPEDKTRKDDLDVSETLNEEGEPLAEVAKRKPKEPVANDVGENPQPAFDNTEAWIKLLFGLSFFHAVIQERRKYGPLGWNIKYEFNDSDLKTSIAMLEVFLRDNEDIPWESLHYMTGQINYGGRVTDDWDRVLLLSLLGKFFSVDVVEDEDIHGGYKFSPSGIYYVPKHETVAEIRQYIAELPWTEEPEVFGMHANASIAFQKNESDSMINTILDVQPRESGGGEGKSADEIVSELAEQLEAEIPLSLDREEAAKGLFAINSQGLMQCLSTVLVQEMERFNRLLKKIASSLVLLQKAIQGLVEMSMELDLMYTSLLNNRVPDNWARVAYPSLKPLSSWFVDLKERVEFMRNWLQHGHPSSFWLSGFFFPHGFMTGTLQTYSRNYEKPIDQLKFSFKVMHTADHTEITKGPKDGVYVYGLYLEAARWNKEEKVLDDNYSVPGQMVVQFPLIHFLPTMTDGSQDAQKAKPQGGPDEPLEVYECPCYKTSVRAGVLTTTGQSSNFILPIDIPSNEPSEYWTQKGAALLTMINE